jgi:hypothetical protein
LLVLILIITFASAFLSFLGENADNLLHKDLQGNCTVNFVPNTTTSAEAFSMDLEEWNYVSNSCKEQWKTLNKKNSVAELIVGGNYSQLVVELNDGSKEDPQRKLVVLFTYELAEPAVLGKFCFALKETNIRNQCFTDVYTRISMYNHTEQVAVLGFWYYFILAADQSSLPINSSDSLQEIITLITSEVKLGYSNSANFWRFFELSIEIQKYFLPMLVSGYYNKGTIRVGLHNLLRALQSIGADYLGCVACNELYFKLKIDGKLDLMEAIDLRASIQKLLDEGSSSAENEDDKKICTNVTQEILKHSNAHVEIFLALYDAGDINQLREHRHVHYFISDIVRLRYSKGNLTQLMDLLWGNYKKIRKPLKFGCDSTVYFAEEMVQHPDHIESLRNSRNWQKLCPRLVHLCTRLLFLCTT